MPWSALVIRSMMYRLVASPMTPGSCRIPVLQILQNCKTASSMRARTSVGSVAASRRSSHSSPMVAAYTIVRLATGLSAPTRSEMRRSTAWGMCYLPELTRVRLVARHRADLSEEQWIPAGPRHRVCDERHRRLAPGNRRQQRGGALLREPAQTQQRRPERSDPRYGCGDRCAAGVSRLIRRYQ